MKRNTLIVALIAIMSVWSSSGCSPAFTGVSGNSLYSNGPDDVKMTADSSLKLMGHGRMYTGIKSGTLIEATAQVNYAVFADSDSGPVKRHAHAMIADLGNGGFWRFSTLSYPLLNSIASTGDGKDVNGRIWRAQLLFIPEANDWVSEIWKKNERSAPKLWIAKRWSYDNVANNVRSTAEYREEFPVCLFEREPAKGESPYKEIKKAMYPLTHMPPACYAELKAFEDRADKAFEFANGKGMPAAEESPSKIKVPGMMYPENLMGPVEMTDKEIGRK